MFYGGGTRFSETVCQWIKVNAVKIGKRIHYKMCGHGGECTVNVWVLNDNGKKTP